MSVHSTTETEWKTSRMQLTFVRQQKNILRRMIGRVRLTKVHFEGQVAVIMCCRPSSPEFFLRTAAAVGPSPKVIWTTEAVATFLDVRTRVSPYTDLKMSSFRKAFMSCEDVGFEALAGGVSPSGGGIPASARFNLLSISIIPYSILITAASMRASTAASV